jgi:hypothetical protein
MTPQREATQASLFDLVICTGNGCSLTKLIEITEYAEELEQADAE